MEDVSLGEFIGWLFTSGAFLIPIAAAVAWKVIRGNTRSDRAIRAKMRELGIIDEAGRRIPRDLPPPSWETMPRHHVGLQPPPAERLRVGDTWQADPAAPTRKWSGTGWTP
jgi:hypothetical protein